MIPDICFFELRAAKDGLSTENLKIRKPNHEDEWNQQ